MGMPSPAIGARSSSHQRCIFLAAISPNELPEMRWSIAIVMSMWSCCGSAKVQPRMEWINKHTTLFVQHLDFPGLSYGDK